MNRHVRHPFKGRLFPANRFLILILALSIFAACDREPSGPAAGRPAPLALELHWGTVPAGRAPIESIEASIWSGSRRLAGPVSATPGDGGDFSIELTAAIGAERRAAVAAFEVSRLGLPDGAAFFGLSDEFSLTEDEVRTVPVTFEFFEPRWGNIPDESVGSSRLFWHRVPRATRYRVFEQLDDGVQEVGATDDTSLVVTAIPGVPNRTFRVRAENIYVNGALGGTYTITILPGSTGGGDNWERLDNPSAPAPSPRYGMAGAWDAGGRRLLIYGGQFEDSVDYDSTLWAFRLSNNTWEQIDDGSGTRTSPVGRVGGLMAPAPDGSGVYLFNGFNVFNIDPVLEVWRFNFSLSRWERLATAAAAMEVGITQFSFGTFTGSLWVTGTGAGSDLYYFESSENLLYRFDLGQRTWSLVQTSGVTPIMRFTPLNVWDAPRRILWSFGGLDLSNAMFSEALYLYSEAANSWILRSPGAALWPPGGFGGGAMDSRGRLLIFGPGLTSEGDFDPLWIYTPPAGAGPALGTWELQSTPDQVAILGNAAATGFDTSTNRVVTVPSDNSGDNANPVYGLKVTGTLGPNRPR